MTSKNIAIVVVAFLVFGGGAFYGGTVYEKSSLSKQGLLRSTTTQFGNRMPVQGSRQGLGGFNKSGENTEFLAGEIISKDDKSVTVKTRDGGSKIVYFSESTKIGKTTEGSLADLESGKEVMISGKANQDGSFNAQNIQIRPVQ